MTQAWLLVGFLTLSGGQIIYPDQYEMMKISTVSPYAYTNGVRASGIPAERPALQAGSNSQPVQVDQQFNQQSASKISDVGPPAVRPLYPSTTPVSFQPSIPTTTPEPVLADWNNHVNNIISRGIMKFSLDLDKAIYNTRGTSVASHRENVIFSPLSISVALLLVLLGSAGRTFDEVSRVLGLEAGVDISQNSEVVHQMFGLLLSTVNYRVEGSNGPRVNSASGIFVQNGYPIRPEFNAISGRVYNSEVINLDFQRNGREARETINNWVKQRTMGKISSILNDTPNPMTSVILLSALYFNGEWHQHFLEGQTRRKQFFIEPNDVINVDMMYNGGNFPFYEDKTVGVKILALPYKGLEMSMYVLLPKLEGATALKNFREQLTAETIEYLISNLKNQTCIIGLPRMKLSSTLSLNGALQNLGLHSLFDPKSADLSLLSGGYGQAIPASSAAATQQSVPVSPSPIPQILPQPLPQALSQVSSERSSSSRSNDYLIFSRSGGDNNNQNVANGVRRNYFRTRRNVVDRRQRDDAILSRGAYVTENDNPGKIKPELNDENTKYVSLEENKYRFRHVEKETKTKNRTKRQSRPMDESFLRFLQSKNFSSYGLDNLRNSANLVNPGLFADEVLHKVEMDVTEKGTEAAAATGVILERDGNQKRLVANRPFLFFIRHDSTKLILFWGTVNTPTPNYAVVR
ncbi:serine protease inhibitor 28Dc isoform X2 [Linepithema humile]|uniref:serine protease inhibitor 28Dc isoform X2 n=1 Tax=Linepithema humile TaxID=83485 RepID=UPI0006233BC7|nr:PREDICTED: leukocyte elastase inhibitor isoform X2 [Linepithema humile]